MLTLDTLARMADRMPTEASADGGRPPYRRPDDGLRVRHVSLPSVAEERRRALSLFAFVVGTSVAVFTATGLVVAHGAELAAGVMPDPRAALQTALWFAGWTAALAAPFAGVGLARELRRFRRVREAIGEHGWLDARGVLHSEDGRRTSPLR